MRRDFDVVIVGSGPSGISAAFPLLEAGLSVALVDGGRVAEIACPQEPYFDWRFSDDDQWRWTLGTDFSALRQADAVSPKLRVPGHQYVFDGFNIENKIRANSFAAFGSLAQGGLSNSWGCGVSRLSAKEISECPFTLADIEPSYASVAGRIGISGRADDDMAEFFGLDAWAQSAIPIDDLQKTILQGYQAAQRSSPDPSFCLGRSRVAVLSEPLGDRKGCDRSSNCLWGCRNAALYSAVDDLSYAKSRFQNLTHFPGFLVDAVSLGSAGPVVNGHMGEEELSLRGRRVILATGALSTSRLAMRALGLHTNQKLQSCPTAAFMLWVPRLLGRSPSMSFGLGQLSFSIALEPDISAFGSLFSTTGLPIGEFVAHIPLRRRYGIDFMRTMLGSCVVGNIFLPGNLTEISLDIESDGGMRVQGSFGSAVARYMKAAKNRLRRHFWKAGALMLPMSFQVGKPGGDIHYAGSFPMMKFPKIGETDARGEVFGLPCVHIVDGACLPVLSGKSHTLTLMANADRISRKIVDEMICV